MKVICIDDSPGRLSGLAPKFKVGEHLDATQAKEERDYYIQQDLYKLNGRMRSWCKSRFIPLSSIDETEFERNYNLEKV